MRRPLVLFSILVSLAGCGSSGRFARFEEEYWSKWLRANPSIATGVGVHDYDGSLEDYSLTAIRARNEELERLFERLQYLDGLTAEEAIDAEILRSAIRAEMVELREVQNWKSNPMMYVGSPGGAIDALMKRNFAPKRKRLDAVISRLGEVPKVVAAMKQNVSNPPKEFTDLAIRMASGSVGFYKETVANWAKDAAAGDAAALARFTSANDDAVAAMTDAAAWLQSDLLPRSNGRYAIGPERFTRKLRYEEMVDTPLDRLLAIGEANLEKDYKAFVATARRIDPSKSPAEVMAAISNDHPSHPGEHSPVSGGPEDHRPPHRGLPARRGNAALRSLRQLRVHGFSRRL